jgi:hypothetical protein
MSQREPYGQLTSLEQLTGPASVFVGISGVHIGPVNGDAATHANPVWQESSSTHEPPLPTAWLASHFFCELQESPLRHSSLGVLAVGEQVAPTPRVPPSPEPPLPAPPPFPDVPESPPPP